MGTLQTRQTSRAICRAAIQSRCEQVSGQIPFPSFPVIITDADMVSLLLLHLLDERYSHPVTQAVGLPVDVVQLPAAIIAVTKASHHGWCDVTIFAPLTGYIMVGFIHR